VWSIPATFGQNGTPCNFPADATQITHTNNDVANVAWTSQTLVTPQSPANNTGNTSNSGSYTNNNNSPTPNSPTPTPTTHCVVPNLRGKTLRTAKKAPSRAHCKLGKVRKKRAARRYRGKVISQSPRRGTVKPAGAKVSVVVGR
jgi:beta-lactam-binding protein with PASTA domain